MDVGSVERQEGEKLGILEDTGKVDPYGATVSDLHRDQVGNEDLPWGTLEKCPEHNLPPGS